MVDVEEEKWEDGRGIERTYRWRKGKGERSGKGVDGEGDRGQC